MGVGSTIGISIRDYHFCWLGVSVSRITLIQDRIICYVEIFSQFSNLVIELLIVIFLTDCMPVFFSGTANLMYACTYVSYMKIWLIDWLIDWFIFPASGYARVQQYSSPWVHTRQEKNRIWVIVCYKIFIQLNFAQDLDYSKSVQPSQLPSFFPAAVVL